MGPKKQLKENILRLFRSHEYSDLKITSRGEAFEVRKAIICPRSEFFRRACKDGAWKEGQSQEIIMQDDLDMHEPMNDPVYLKYMLQYLYGQDYFLEPDEPEEPEAKELEESDKEIINDLPKENPLLVGIGMLPESALFWEVPDEEKPTASEPEPDPSITTSSGDSAAVHAWMCAIADFYGIPDLQAAAQGKFSVALTGLSDEEDIIMVFKLVCDPAFLRDDELRDSVARKIAYNQDLLDKLDVEEILCRDGELTLAVAKEMRAIAK